MLPFDMGRKKKRFPAKPAGAPLAPPVRDLDWTLTRLTGASFAELDRQYRRFIEGGNPAAPPRATRPATTE